MDKILRDFSGMKVSAIKTAAREMLVEDFMEFLSMKYETVAKVGPSEVAVVVGTVKDADGFEQDVIVTAKATAKSFYDKTSDVKREVHKFNIYDEAEAYEMEEKAKAAKKKASKEDN